MTATKTLDELQEMTRGELAEFGSTEMEPPINFKANESHPKMVTAIAEALGVVGKAKSVASSGKGRRRNEQQYKITIMQQQGIPGAVDICVNGDVTTIIPGHEVIVGESVKNALDDAVLESFYQDPETGERHEIRAMRFPYQCEKIV